MTDITQLLGKDADSLLQHRCMTIPATNFIFLATITLTA